MAKFIIGLSICFLYFFIFSCSSEKSHNQQKIDDPATSGMQTKAQNALTYSNVWENPGPKYKWVPLWLSDSNLNVSRASLSVVVDSGYVYAIGGGASSGNKKIIYSSVEFAKIQSDGSLGPWKMTSPMNTKRIFAAAVARNGYIYAIGGEKGYDETVDLLDTVERAKIFSDGSLGPWKMETSVMNTNRRGLVASSYKGWIYVFGGYNGVFLKDIERSRVNPDGSLQEWIHEAEEAINQRYVHSGVIFKNIVYLFGGHAMSLERGTNTVERATINSNGKLSKWRNLSLMSTKRFGGAAVVLRDTVYVVGGQNTIPLTAVDKAPLLPDGSLGVWSRDTPLQESRVGGGLVAGKDVLYLIGGYNGKKYLKEVQRAYYVPGKPLGVWVNDPKLIADLSEFDKKLHTDARNHFNLGLQRYMEKRYDNAIIEFKLGIEVDQEFAQFYNFLGLAYQAKEMYDDAVLQYTKAAELWPTLVPAYFNLGNVYLEMGMVKKSEEMYRKAIELEPKFIDAKIKYLQLLADTERCAEAKPELELLGETLPKHPAIQELKKRCDFLLN